MPGLLVRRLPQFKQTSCGVGKLINHALASWCLHRARRMRAGVVMTRLHIASIRQRAPPNLWDRSSHAYPVHAPSLRLWAKTSLRRRRVFMAVGPFTVTHRSPARS